MGRELQKKKRRSSIPKVKQKPKSKKVNPLGNAVIAANWDKSQTLTQNYRRLGLTSRLNGVTGGIEKLRAGPKSSTSTTSKLAIQNWTPPTNIVPTEARVERDVETGKILRVIHEGKARRERLWGDLGDDDEGMEGQEGSEEANGGDWEGFEDDGQDDDGRREQNPIIRQLEDQASRIPEKKERKQSEGEKEWVERLVTRHGDDYKGMMRDRRLNPMQQTESDLRRRVQKWKANGGVVGEVAMT